MVDAGGTGLPAAARRRSSTSSTAARARARRRRSSASAGVHRGARGGARRRRRPRRRHRRPPLRGHVLPRGARRDDPGVQGRVGRHRRLDRGRRRRRHLELPHPHRRHRRRRSRPPSTIGRPRKIRVTDLLEQVEEERWVREAEPMPRPSPSLAHEPVTTAVVAVATGDGIRRIFHSLGVQRIVTGGQSMNPSTAELLEAVEAAPADQVVILPEQQEHHPGGRAGRRPHRRRRCASCPPGASPRASPRCWPTTPRPTVDDNADGDGRGRRQRGGRRGHPGGARLLAATSGPIAEGDCLGIARDGIRAVERRPRRRGHQAARPSWSPTTTRSSRSSRARASSPADHPPHHRVARRAPPRRRPPRSTTAASRSTRTSSASSSRPPMADGACSRTRRRCPSPS